MFKIKPLCLTLFSLSVFGMSVVYADTLNPTASTTLHSLSDEQLSETTGQALMSLSYIAPTDATNLEAKRKDGAGNIIGAQNIGFYKLGLEAELELNANIKKLQLGCGGVNGVGGCDIDIDNLSLSGLGNSASSSTGSDADRVARVGSSAVLTNPFMQFAIKNPNSASTRELVGINLSSEKAIGLLTFGQENSSVKNGINSLSGYMEVAKTTGLAKVYGFGSSLVSGENSLPTLKQSDGYDPINGKACCVLFVPIDFSTTSYDLNLRDKATGSNILKGDLDLPQQPITGKRINSAILKATAKVRDIDLSGKLSATAISIPLNNKDTNGTIQNLTVDVSIDENLGYFHKASLNGTPASLSLQSQDLQWPGNKSTAAKGWWLEFSNPIDIGKIDPTDPVAIPKPTLNAAFKQVGDYLKANPVMCGYLVASSCLFGGTISVSTVDLSNALRPKMDLNNIQLAKQDFTPNCYGTLKFC